MGTINTTTGVITDIGALGDNFANIEFTRSVIPEPTSLMLIGMGLVGLMGCRRRKRA